ncbi:MAG: hypothetical protein OXP36_01020, partial [Gammaproteobacteria bacterium]|nr:hypothetical protein [Gammaproteobacteria bacterium]
GLGQHASAPGGAWCGANSPPGIAARRSPVPGCWGGLGWGSMRRRQAAHGVALTAARHSRKAKPGAGG